MLEIFTVEITTEQDVEQNKWKHKIEKECVVTVYMNLKRWRSS